MLLFASVVSEAEPSTFTVSSSQSEVRFVLDAPFDSITGISHAVSGTVRHDPNTGNTTGHASVDLTSFRTGIALRDQDLREQFFQTGTYPTANLVVTRLENWRLREDGVREGQLVGTFSLHGVDRILQIPVEVRSAEDGGRPVLYVQGRFNATLADYGISRPRVLFLKLGPVAVVRVHLVLVGPPPQVGTPVAEQPAAPPQAPFRKTSIVLVTHPVKLSSTERKAEARRYRFAGGTAQGRGERMINDASLGVRGSGVTCGSCHSVNDERRGLADEGFVHPNRSLFDSARRPLLWQGIAKTPGKAGSLCVRLFMLNPKGLTAAQEADLDSYLKGISPDDVAPALDYRVLALTRQSTLARPTEGNRALGSRLEKQYCEGCHAAGKMRPPLTPGLYEPDYLVQRVRWLPGRDSRQMPPIYMDRLTDSDLRHIVTYLAGDESQRIFKRSREKQESP